jgi:STIP1 family protein 1
MSRLKLAHWESVLSDCHSSLALLPDHMKGHYYLAQAQLELGRPSDALESAQRAYELCVKTNDKSMGAVVALVLRAKKEKWEKREKRRLREEAGLMTEAIERMQEDMQKEVEAEEDEGVKKDIIQGYEEKIQGLRGVFEKADPKYSKREVPDWVIDDITFAIMHDPVVVCLAVDKTRDVADENRPRQEIHTTDHRLWNTCGEAPRIP